MVDGTGRVASRRFEYAEVGPDGRAFPRALRPKGRAAEVLDDDALVTSWPELDRRAGETAPAPDGQGTLLV